MKHHIETLQSELSRRINTNPLYSLRSFSRDLGVSASSLSCLLTGKKGLSSKRATLIAQKLNLNQLERELFVVSAKASHERNKKYKEKAKLKLEQLLLKKKETKSIMQDNQSHANKWFHLAILEAIEIDGFDHTCIWISNRLQIPLSIVENAIHELEKIGWIERKDNKLIATHCFAQSTTDVPSTVIKKFHEELLLKASQEIYTQSVENREYLNMTLAFNKRHLPSVKQYLRKVQSEFAEMFYNPNESKNSVYQLSIQFFRLDKGSS